MYSLAMYVSTIYKEVLLTGVQHLSILSVLSSLPPHLPTIEDEGSGGRRDGEKEGDASLTSAAAQCHTPALVEEVRIP